MNPKSFGEAVKTELREEIGSHLKRIDKGIEEKSLILALGLAAMLIVGALITMNAIASTYQYWRIIDMPETAFVHDEKWMIEPNWLLYRAKVYGHSPNGTRMVLAYPAYGDYAKIVSHSMAAEWIAEWACNDSWPCYANTTCHYDISRQDQTGEYAAARPYQSWVDILILFVTGAALLIVSAGLVLVWLIKRANAHRRERGEASASAT